jgi:SPP1 gp7 family putative phage head morphogenesis protein
MIAAVVEVERKWRAALAAGDAATVEALSARYEAMAARLMANFEALAEQVARMAAADEAVPIGRIYRLERYQRLIVEMLREWQEFAPHAEALISAAQRQALDDGLKAAAELRRAGGYAPAYVDTFAMEGYPKAALEQLVGQTQGGPLRALLDAAMDGNADEVARALSEGIGLGRNPALVARQMADAYGLPLVRALCIARTEMLGAFRSSSLESYRNSGLTQYERISAQDDRVCAGCIAAEGELFSTEQDFDDHPNCRCACLPYWPGIGGDFKLGEAWFTEQPESTQRSILGNTRYGMYKSGEVKFHQFATRTSNDTWGGAVVATTIRDLKAGGGGLAEFVL